MSRNTVVIPLRGIHHGKSRLSGLLNPLERAAVVSSMAEHVIESVVSSAIADTILLVTRDRDLFSHIHPGPGKIEVVVQADEVAGLNGAIDLGRNRALLEATDRLVILSADLPLLHSTDLVGIVTVAADVVIGADRANTGTNALMINGRLAIRDFRFQFGVGSRSLHQAESERLDLLHACMPIPGIAHDLDTPEDWDMLNTEVRQQLLAPRSTRQRNDFHAAERDSVAILEHA